MVEDSARNQRGERSAATYSHIAACIRSSYIARFDIHDLRVTNAFCGIVSEQAPHTDIGQLHFRTTDWTDADEHVIALLIDTFASVGRLDFFKCKFKSSQITDDFLRTCLIRGVSDMRISETAWGFGERSFSISDDGIMDFCIAPADGTRMLVADSIPVTEQLFPRIVEVATLGRLTDFMMTLKGVDTQLHHNHDYGQFLVSESDFMKLYDFPALNLRVRFTSWDSTMHVRSYGCNPAVGEGSILNA
ncbi:hypothetical protein AAVH_20998 [Aphelenchoides avenae]|nr:hypothetical protein AAVH_20998 [Aphelenchus avenae]